MNNKVLLKGLIPDNLSDEVGSPRPMQISLRKDSSVGDLPRSASSSKMLPTKLELLMHSTRTTESNSKAISSTSASKEENKSNSRMNLRRPPGLSMKKLNSQNNVLEPCRPKFASGLNLAAFGVSSYQSSSSIVQVESNADAELLCLQENQARCEFFQKYSYDRQRHLGTGYSSSVYECDRIGQTSEDSPKLAVKICNDDGEGCQLKSVKSENKILKKMLGRPGVSQVIDYYEDLEDIVATCYLVMRYAGSKNINQYIKSKHHDPSKSPVEIPNLNTIKSLAAQLIIAIDGIHKANICHRDLKPDNIVIRNYQGETQLTVIDFNVAVDLEKSDVINGNTGLKQWSAPETRSQPIYNNKCDIWSFGCLLYFMFTQKSPFNDRPISEESVEELLQLLHEKIISDKDILMAEQLVQLLGSLWQFDPAKRPSSTEVLEHPFFSEFI